MNNSLDHLLPCTPPFWARGGQSQTILGHLLPSPPLSEKGERIIVRLPDGDRLITYLHQRSPQSLVILFHGLGGSTDADYIARTSQIALTAGHSVARINHRGCGDGQGLARGIYHSGRSEDVSEVIGFFRGRLPQAKILALGFSLSGNALLRLLSGGPGNALPDCAISVNAPIDLDACSRLLTAPQNRIYDLRFVLKAKSDIRSREIAGLSLGRTQIPWHISLREFDDIYTAPLGGFRNREDYYQTCSTAKHFEKILTPTHVLAAVDDPFIEIEAYRVARLGSGIRLRIENHGGHMGYLTEKPTPLGTRRWLDWYLSTAIEDLLAQPTPAMPK